ncbi:MAG: HNH endonuclease [Chloroflexi bacterium]|nr:HNH endonuclease [Chloroflexota bacterium]
MNPDLNRPVLVLNANYEPLNVCDTKRAIGLLVTGKAELMVNGRGHFHTARMTYPAPSVIRLEKMIRRPRPRVKLSKREIFRRDNYTCQYCGRQPPHLTIDHIIPRHRGGGHHWDNLVTACPACNRRKGGKTAGEAQMSLKHKPGEPPATAAYLFGRHLKENSEWEKYITGW